MPWIFPELTRWEKITDGLRRMIRPVVELPHTIRHIFRQTMQVIDYLPVIWNNHDWSAEPGCYELLRKKLQRMEPVLREGHLLNGPRYARQIRVALSLLDRIIADDYEHQAHQAHEIKWGDNDTWFEPQPGKTEKDAEWFEMKSSNYPNAKTPELQEQARQELFDMVRAAHERRQRDIEFLFKHLAKRMPGWWD